MDHGSSFSLDRDLSDLNNGYLIFNYRRIEVLKVDRDSFPKYPIYVYISSEYVNFEVHLVNDKELHMHLNLFKIPLDGKMISDTDFVDKLKCAYSVSFAYNPESGAYLTLPKYIKLVDLPSPSYSRLSVFRDNMPINEINFLLRILILDFLFDLDRSDSIFDNSPNSASLLSKICQNTLFSAMLKKARYYYFREEFLGDNPVRVKTAMFPLLTQKTKDWVNFMLTLNDETMINNSEWCGNVELELLNVFKMDISTTKDSCPKCHNEWNGMWNSSMNWLLRRSSFTNAVGFIHLPNQTSFLGKVRDRMEKNTFFDKFLYVKTNILLLLQNLIIVLCISGNSLFNFYISIFLLASFISLCQLSKEATFEIHEKYLSFQSLCSIGVRCFKETRFIKYITRQAAHLFELLKGFKLFRFIVSMDYKFYGTVLVFIFILINFICFLAIIPVVILLFMSVICFNRDKVSSLINLFLPRLGAIIMSTWIVLISNGELLKSFCDLDMNLGIYFFQSIIILSIMMLFTAEIKKINLSLSWKNRMKSSFWIIFLGLVYSLGVGILLSSFSSKKMLENSSFMKDVIVRNMKDNRSFDMDNCYSFLSKVFVTECIGEDKLDTFKQRAEIMIEKHRTLLDFLIPKLRINSQENDFSYLGSWPFITNDKANQERLLCLISMNIANKMDSCDVHPLDYSVDFASLQCLSLFKNLMEAPLSSKVYFESLKYFTLGNGYYKNQLFVEIKLPYDVYIRFFPVFLVVFSCFAMFIGVFLQVIIENKKLTEGI